MVRYHERLTWWLNSLGVALLALSVLLVPATLSNADTGGGGGYYYGGGGCSARSCDPGGGCYSKMPGVGNGCDGGNCSNTKPGFDCSGCICSNIANMCSCNLKR